MARDLIALGEAGVLMRSMSFDGVAVGEVGVTDFFEVGEGGERFGGLAGDVETKIPHGGFFFGGDLAAALGVVFDFLVLGFGFDRRH